MLRIVMPMPVLQLPSRDKYNCVSIRRFLVYKKRHLSSGGHRYQLLQNVYMPQARLSNINQYRNLTIGVSLINNAELESDVVDYVIVGSQYNPCCHCMVNVHTHTHTHTCATISTADSVS